MSKQPKPKKFEEKKNPEVLNGTGFEIGKCTPGMSDLMRRLYEVRIDCGQFDDDEARKNAYEMQKNGLKKLDAFEIKKVDMDKLLRDVLLNLEDKANGGDEQVNKNLIKNLTKVDKLFKEMQAMHEDAKNRKNRWAKTALPDDLRQQREKDLEAIQQCIQKIKAQQKKLLMGGKEDKKIDAKKPKFDNVDDFVKGSKQPIELPTIDISDGLRQIEENKRKQNELLDVLDGQVNQLADIANSIGLELDKQALMLDKMAVDVEKHNATLSNLNKDLDKAIEQVGGGTRLIICGCILIILIALIGVLYLVISAFVKIPGTSS
jgi:methyl-accepting chemotaxis protein